MLLGFGYFHVYYVIFLFFFKKQKIIDQKKAIWPKVFYIIFLFSFKVGSVGLIDQKINFVLP